LRIKYKNKKKRYSRWPRLIDTRYSDKESARRMQICLLVSSATYRYLSPPSSLVEY